MIKSEVENFVTSYFAQQIKNGDTSPSFKEMGIDSLSMVEFIMSLEDMFGVEISADEIDEAGGIDQFAGIVERLLKTKRP
jgi:acyl carrier protein